MTGDRNSESVHLELAVFDEVVGGASLIEFSGLVWPCGCFWGEKLGAITRATLTAHQLVTVNRMPTAANVRYGSLSRHRLGQRKLGASAAFYAAFHDALSTVPVIPASMAA